MRMGISLILHTATEHEELKGTYIGVEEETSILELQIYYFKIYTD